MHTFRHCGDRRAALRHVRDWNAGGPVREAVVGLGRHDGRHSMCTHRLLNLNRQSIRPSWLGPTSRTVPRRGKARGILRHGAWLARAPAVFVRNRGKSKNESKYDSNLGSSKLDLFRSPDQIRWSRDLFFTVM